jgi:hypothetical protein
MEYEILSEFFDEIICFGDSRLIDGVNAFPLVRAGDGGRNANVEADMLLLLQNPRGFQLAVAEVKDLANNAWFTAVENLRRRSL